MTLQHLKSNSSKKEFIEMIENNLICAGNDVNSDGDELDEDVMKRLKDHLNRKSWEDLCNGNAFINILEHLREEEDIESELFFDELLELDDKDAIDWHSGNGRHMFKDENSWWNLLFYARKDNLTNLEKYCRNRLFIRILLAHLNKDRLILHMNRSSEFAEDKDLFKLAVFLFLDEYSWGDQYSQKENWVALNAGAIIGIMDNFEKFSHITNEEVLENVFHWCKEITRNKSEAKERFLNILGPGLI